MDNTDEIKHFLKDEFLMKQCQDATKTMIEAGMKIDEEEEEVQQLKGDATGFTAEEDGETEQSKDLLWIGCAVFNSDYEAISFPLPIGSFRTKPGRFHNQIDPGLLLQLCKVVSTFQQEEEVQQLKGDATGFTAEEDGEKKKKKEEEELRAFQLAMFHMSRYEEEEEEEVQQLEGDEEERAFQDWLIQKCVTRRR